MTEMVYLQAPGGHIAAMSLPVHPAIEDHWRKGKLTRVNPDGSPWEGEIDLPGESDKIQDDEEGKPIRPRDNAHRQRWVEYVVAMGICPVEDTNDMRRSDLIELATPPEMKLAPV